MRGSILLVCLILASCAHKAPAQHRQNPSVQTRATLRPGPAAPGQQSHCQVPPMPSLPDPAVALGLVGAIDDLKVRDRLLSDYAQRLKAALEACRH